MRVGGQLRRGRVLHPGSGNSRPFVVSQKNGTWQPAQTVIFVPSVGDLAGINSVSCASPGNWSAGGSCRNAQGRFPPFVVSQKGGTWEKAIQVPGSLFNVGIFAGTFSVSCRSARNCSAGGDYNSKVATKETQPWVDSWGPATPVPGRVMIPAKLSANGYLTRVCHAVPANVALTPRGEGLDWSNQVTGA